MAFDPAADGDDQVFVFERDGDRWRQVPSPQPATYEPPPVTVHWTETNWVPIVEGWAQQLETSGSFVLDEELRQKLSAGFREAVAAGKLLISSTTADDLGRAYLNHHIEQARSA